jgi:hypothetical protein
VKSLDMLPYAWMTPSAFTHGSGSLWLSGYVSEEENDGAKLFEFDRKQQHWTTHRAEYMEMPEGDIRSRLHINGVVWISATDAVARYDTARHVWDTRWIARIDNYDSLRYELRDAAPSADPIGSSIDIFLQAFGLPSTPARLRALRAVDPIPLLTFANAVLDESKPGLQDSFDALDEAATISALARPELEEIARAILALPRKDGDEARRRTAQAALARMR